MEDLNKLLGELADIQKDLPDFIKEGDKIKVDTRTKEYIERDNS